MIKYDGDLDEKKIGEVLKARAKNDYDVLVADTFDDEYRSDQDWGWHHLVGRYLSDEEIRPIIDGVFVDLCGWSLATLLRKAHSKLAGRSGVNSPLEAAER